MVGLVCRRLVDSEISLKELSLKSDAGFDGDVVYMFIPIQVNCYDYPEVLCRVNMT